MPGHVRMFNIFCYPVIEINSVLEDDLFPISWSPLGECLQQLPLPFHFALIPLCPRIQAKTNVDILHSAQTAFSMPEVLYSQV